MQCIPIADQINNKKKETNETDRSHSISMTRPNIG